MNSTNHVSIETAIIRTQLAVFFTFHHVASRFFAGEGSTVEALLRTSLQARPREARRRRTKPNPCSFMHHVHGGNNVDMQS